jgi:phosphoglycerate dehydrogenase-like enzyme
MRVLFAAGRMTELRWARDIFPAQRLEELRQVAEVDVTHATDEQTLKEKAKDADIIIGAATRVTAEIINSARNLKMIQVPSIGFDHVDAETADANGVVICNVGESCANSVAELCFAFVLDLARRVSLHDRDMRARARLGESRAAGDRQDYGDPLQDPRNSRFRHNRRTHCGDRQKRVRYEGAHG